jgi:hypothetical protein
MKTKTLLIILVATASTIFAQTASTYFPSQSGYKWNFKSVPLDSLNNLIDSLTFFAIDSFAVVATHKGKTADVVLTKRGTENLINSLPYLDSVYYSFENSNGLEYFDPLAVSDLLGNIDSTIGINFLNFFASLEGWYPYYKMSSTVNQAYQIFKKDTTVIINSQSVPLRFELIGKRFSDESITTEIGTFNCKKFLLERRLSYLVTIPPFPTIAVKILGVEENLWLAPNNWKVKSYIPATNVDLSIAGIPAFYVPGLETNILTSITDVQPETQIVESFLLLQNYPNPFNPSTKIGYNIPSNVDGKMSNVTLIIYDVLGNEVATLVNEQKVSGYYEVEFNANNLVSGVYIYRLQVGGLTLSKKLILLK